jgi:hypothetical protein
VAIEHRLRRLEEEAKSRLAYTSGFHDLMYVIGRADRLRRRLRNMVSYQISNNLVPEKILTKNATKCAFKTVVQI